MPAQSTSEPKSSDESAASVSLEDSEAYGMVFGEYHASTDADPNALEKQPTRVSVHSPAAFPDGGREAWMCTAGAFFCQFCSFGTTPSISPHRKHLTNVL